MSFLFKHYYNKIIGKYSTYIYLPHKKYHIAELIINLIELYIKYVKITIF